MSHSAKSNSTPLLGRSTLATRFQLWIDGVGSYLFCLRQRVTIGGPTWDGGAADVCLLAKLSRRHATIVRSGDGYLVEAHGPTRVDGKEVTDRAALGEDCVVELGESLRLRFRRPSPLSATARLEFLTDHRPVRSTDGVVLMAETCLLGPGDDCHVRCPVWPQTVLIFRRGESLIGRSESALSVKQDTAREIELRPNDIVTGKELRFRLEET